MTRARSSRRDEGRLFDAHILSVIRSPTAGSIAAGVAGQAAVAVSGVIAARVLGVEDRGYLALVVLFPIVLSHAFSLGVPLAVTFAIARRPASAGRVTRSLAAVVPWQLAAIVVSLAAVVTIVYGGEPRYVWVAALLAAVASPLLLAQQYGLAILQGQHRFLALSVVRALPAVLYAGALAAAGLLLDLGLVAVVALWLGGNLAATSIWGAILLRGLGTDGEATDAPPRRTLVRFGVRGLIGSLSPIETFRLDQLVVWFILSPVALGLYVVGLAFTVFPRLISHSIGLIMYPRVAAETDPARAAAVVWRSLGLCAAITGLFVAVLELLAPWAIGYLFGEEFSAAATATRILLVGSLFLSLRRILIEAAQGVGLPTLGTWSEVVSWIVCVPLLVVLGPRWGIEGVATGVAVASAAGFAFMAVAMSPSFVTRLRPAS
jgi:O-antigen/teichoic acid export membrane protein